MTFVHAFIVCPLVIDSTGILGMDFFHKVGAEISLTAGLLSVNGCHFRLKTVRSEDSVRVTLRLPVSQSWCRAPSGTHDQIFSPTS
jgi:hypothetical protein